MDYIPKDDANFSNWFKNLVDYVMLHISEPSEDMESWGDIPQHETQALYDAWNDWNNHYPKTLVAHTPAVTIEKNNSRKRAEAVIRPFVQRFLHWEPVTDADRKNMNIPIRDKKPTPHIDVHEEIELEITVHGIRRIIVNFRVKGAAGKAKPEGYDGAVIAWDVLDAPPHRPEELTKHLLASHTPKEINFDETQRGKTVYVAAAWQNHRGNCGKWSEIHSAFIP